MKIRIKRATTDGLKEAEGDFFEANGMQFCLVKVDGFYFAIDLYTGCSVKSFDSNNYSKKQAIKLAKENINHIPPLKWKSAINRVSKEYCVRYKFSLPVNEPVKTSTF
jgi:hypothetical protein